MKAAMIFTGSGPILILTSFSTLDHPALVEKLAAKGIAKYIAYELPVEKVQRMYGTRFSMVLGDLSQTDDMRVMDIDGHHVFNSFSFEELGKPIYSTGIRRPEPLGKVSMETVPLETITFETSPGEGATEAESEWLYVKIDEFGKLVESTYMPMLGSLFDPPMTVEPSLTSKLARFRINPEGLIVDGTPEVVNGRRLVHREPATPALGRYATVIPRCTWKPDRKGDWVCE